MSSPKTLNTYHPKDCTYELASTVNKYTYIENDDGTVASNSDIAVLDGFYSYPNPNVIPVNSVNPFSNDVLYSLEFGESCYTAVTADQCNPYDIEGKNPFRYKAYYPKESLHDYTARPLPVYVLFHAGGFMECTTNEDGQIKQLCIELSQKGFISFTVEYRRGRIFDTSDTTKVSVQQQFARYRAIQDGCGDIRTIIKKNGFYGTSNPDRFYFKILLKCLLADRVLVALLR